MAPRQSRAATLMRHVGYFHHAVALNKIEIACSRVSPEARPADAFSPPELRFSAGLSDSWRASCASQRRREKMRVPRDHGHHATSLGKRSPCDKTRDN